MSQDRVEKEKEILDSLTTVACQYRAAPTESSFKKLYVPRLFYYHGIDLFRVIVLIPSEYREFPSPAELERRVGEQRKESGKGLSEEKIDKNTEELVRSGVSREVAEKGAKMLRRPKPQTLEPIVLSMVAKSVADELGGFDDEPKPCPFKEFRDDMVESMNEIILKNAENPLDAIEEF